MPPPTSGTPASGPAPTEPVTSEQTTTFESVLDSIGLKRYQMTVVACCALVAMIDGFDTQAIGLVAPEIAAEWRVNPSAFGLVFGVGLFGSLVGALLFGVTSDRFGRKPNLLAAVVVFALVSLVTPLTTSVEGLMLARFLTGFGLGGALPGIISITCEYTPRRMRATIVGLMFCGFPLGATIGGLVAAKLIPAFGWQSVFYFGGGVPLLLLPLLAIRLPESAQFLALRGDRERLGIVLRRMKSPLRAEHIAPEPPVTRSPVASLFTEGRAAGTLLFWAGIFLSLLMAYLLVNWIPLVARLTGVDRSAAVLAVAVLNLGGVIGCLTLGRLADRTRRPTLVLGWGYALGALAIASIGLSNGSASTLLLTSLVAGFLAIGAQICTVALCASFYETALRATGVGWSVGFGRVGAIIGPVLGGLLLGAGVGAPVLFMVTGLAALGAGIAVFAVGRRYVHVGRRESAG
jgi:AAHS family 4-hydroxybenzoate transporter-like MFS transporter